MRTRKKRKPLKATRGAQGAAAMSARVKIVCEKRNRSVLTHSQVVDIFSQRPRSGPTGLTNVRMYTPTELSVFYHVSPKAIRDIWNGR